MDFHPFYDWFWTTLIGFFVVTYWRCTWVLMDIWDCQQPSTANLVDGDSFCFAIPSLDNVQLAQVRIESARFSYGVGLACLAIGVFVMWMGWWVPLRDDLQVTPLKAMVRFGAVYCLGFSCVNLWRGIWYWADDWILPTQPLQSYWLTSVVGSTVAFLLWGGASLLAPPAIFLLDGPGLSSPPIAVTLLSSHYAISLPAGHKLPPLPMPIKVMDLLLSFIVLPFAVVWFWRGSWLLLDYYLWGLTASNRDVNFSILWCFVLAFGLYAMLSEPILGTLDQYITQGWFRELLGRLRTYLLAWATVGFWRGVWLIWDQFLGGTTSLSAGLGHVVAILVLTTIGCVSCICAPASTMGVDSVPNPEAADEPLFSMIPLPWETLHLFGIARTPGAEQLEGMIVPVTASQQEIEMGTLPKESERNTEIQQEQKIRPSRVEEGLVVVVKEEVDGDDEDDDNREDDANKEQPSKLEVTDEHVGTRPLMPPSTTASAILQSGTSSQSPLAMGSTMRGWQPEGSFRNYGDLQRFGPVRFRSEYAQRQHEGNKRTRSKFFRSR